jgi:citrate lyase beta subunit
MRHHQHVKEFRFVRDPIEFDKDTPKSVLQYCLGGTLYMPGTKQILDKILHRDLHDLASMVMCFEDAIRADDLPTAEENVLQHLGRLADAIDTGEIGTGEVPLIFLRVRNTDQFLSFSSRLSRQQASALSGFVFPKFYSSNARVYLEHLKKLNDSLDTKLYGMPILEGKEIAYRESRLEELTRLKSILDEFGDLILNVRVGGTDFSSLFGVRRGINSSIYDILTVRDCLSDILNFFTRVGAGYTVSGPVWEYFLAYKGDNIDTLIAEHIQRSLLNRQPILNEAIDGLLREVVLDKANGFVGKTIIHPSHLKYVNAMHAVTREEYEDAQQILDAGGGVIKSAKANKMNEINPHRNWAHKISSLADAFGVIENESEYLSLCLG